MIPRILGQHLLRLIKQYPVVTLTGPRQSGKTTLCREIFPNYQYANLEDLEIRQRAISDPKGFLAEHTKGAILDEIQRAPELVSYVQVIVDDNPDKAGQFVLTGSQQFEIMNTITQSLAGRSAILKLLPLAYSELYDHQKLTTLSQLLYAGFYPRIHYKNLNPTEALSFYLTTYVERDLRRLVNIRDLSTFERFLKLCATQIGQLMNYSRLANDCGINQETVKAWLSLLKASYILYEIQPHFNNFRKRLVKSSKLYFYDVGFAAYLLGIANPNQINAHPMKGALFENFIVTEFLKNRYNHVRENNLYFFRDHIGNEVDLILDYGQGLISVEIKASQTISHDSLKGLLYYQKISQQKNTKRYLVYAGDKSYIYQDIRIYAYQDLTNIFTELENGA